jgi:hypothetical protein
VKQALKVIDGILDNGVNIFELSENTPYTPEDDDFGKLIVRIVRAKRSHNESKLKSQRISKAWAQKKHHSAPFVSITNKLPGVLGSLAGKVITILYPEAGATFAVGCERYQRVQSQQRLKSALP